MESVSKLVAFSGLVVFVVAFALVVPGASASRHIVGARMGWTDTVNYTKWAEGRRFYLGDYLFFVYDRTQRNVLEVNKTNYESCIAEPFRNWTRGVGRDLVPLNETRPYYFLSGNGYCFSGMKLAVNVKKAPPPPAISAPLKSSAPASIMTNHIVLPAVLVIGAMWDAFVRVV